MRGVFFESESSARTGRVVFADLAEDFVDGALVPLVGVEGQGAGEEDVEDDAEGVDVGTRVDVGHAGGLLGAHEARSANECAGLCKEREIGSGLGSDGFGDAEVNDAGNRLAIEFSDKDVGRFQVAMDDGFLMGVLNAFADLNEQGEAFTNLELFVVAIAGDGRAVNVLHDEVRLAIGSGAGVENFGDGRMIHHGEGLLFGMEALEDGVVVEAAANELESYVAADGGGLFGEPDEAHAAFAEFFQETIGADSFALERRSSAGRRGRCDRVERRVGLGLRGYGIVQRQLLQAGQGERSLSSNGEPEEWEAHGVGDRKRGDERREDAEGET